MIYKKIISLLEENKLFWIATVIKAEGHTPAKAGMKMIIEAEKNLPELSGVEISKKSDRLCTYK